MLRNILLQVTNASVCSLSAKVTGSRRSPVKKPHCGFFPWLPHRCLSPAGLRTSLARSRGGAPVPPRPPVTHACLIRSASRKGSARLPSVAPLRFVPSLVLSAPSVRLRRVGSALPLASNRHRGSLRLCTAFRLTPAVPPSVALSSPLRSAVGGSRCRPFRGLHLGRVSFLAPHRQGEEPKIIKKALRC